MANAKQKAKLLAEESSVVEAMMLARSLAEKIFVGADLDDDKNSWVVGEIFDRLADVDFDKQDSEELVENFERCYEHARAVHKRETPSPLQVCDLYERIHDEPEDD